MATTTIRHSYPGGGESSHGVSIFATLDCPTCRPILAAELKRLIAEEDWRLDHLSGIDE